MVSWIALSLTIIGILLNAKRNILCWIVWILSDIAWIYYLWIPQNKQWALLTMNIVFIIMNIYGWYEWNKNRCKHTWTIWTNPHYEGNDWVQTRFCLDCKLIESLEV